MKGQVDVLEGAVRSIQGTLNRFHSGQAGIQQNISGGTQAARRPMTQAARQKLSQQAKARFAAQKTAQPAKKP
jgi:hypothetical protein